jgi:hypothetical protein
MPKQQSGLGVLDISKMNDTLLLKWYRQWYKQEAGFGNKNFKLVTGRGVYFSLTAFAR